jgi:hypothetical protein
MGGEECKVKDISHIIFWRCWTIGMTNERIDTWCFLNRLMNERFNRILKGFRSCVAQSGFWDGGEGRSLNFEVFAVLINTFDLKHLGDF